MEIVMVIFGIYLFLAVFNAGNMTTLQIQHYGIYYFVGKENFKEYIKANNRSALIPSILPAVLLLLFSIILIFFRPYFMTLPEALIAFLLNITALFSTFKWQRRLQGEMAVFGFDEDKIKLLVSTNWIRVAAFTAQGILACAIVMAGV